MRYRELAASVRDNREMKYLARYGYHEVLEGDPVAGVVLYEVPDTQTAKDWYGSPEYQHAMAYRQSGASWTVILLEGLAV